MNDVQFYVKALAEEQMIDLRRYVTHAVYERDEVGSHLIGLFLNKRVAARVRDALERAEKRTTDRSNKRIQASGAKPGKEKRRK